MSWLRGLIAAGVANPVYSNVLMICILVGGYYAAAGLVTETYPQFSLDRISVTVEYPGAGPEEVEQAVATKIEEVLEGLAGVRRVWSRSDENGCLVIVVLEENVTDSRLMLLDVKDRINQIDSFPPEVRQPVVSEMIVREQVINVAVYGHAPERTIRESAVEIKNELLGMEAISQVELTGVRDYEISIAVSQEALLRYGLTLENVRAVVAKNTLDVPAGTLRTQREELTLRTIGQRYTAQEFEDLVVIAQPDGTLIRLGQLATITDGFEEGYKSGRFQGQRAAVLEIFKTPDQNVSAIAHVVREYVQRKQQLLPEGLHVDVWADNSREVDARISMLLENGVLGMLLVVAFLTVFLDMRVSLFVALGIPISFAGTLIVMHFMGQTLNMITLFGLIMCTGIIVDDAIVIADSFRIRVVAGDKPMLAAVNGPHGVALPVLASSATTIVAFAPLLFVSGIMGKFIAVLPAVVISTIVFSAIEAFCILPAHLQHSLHDPKAASGLARWRASTRTRIENWVDRVIANWYRPVIVKAVRNYAVTICVAVGCFLAAAGLVLGARTPFTLLPEVDSDTLRARVQFPQGVPVARAQEAVRQLEAAADRLNSTDILPRTGQGDLVIRKFSVLGEWSGWIDEQGSHLCEVMLELMPAEQRRLDSEAVLAAWEQQTGRIDDAISVAFTRVQRGPAEKPLEIRLLGPDLDELEAAADEIVDRLNSFAGVSGASHDLLPGKREVQIRLKPLARTLGVALDDLARQLRSGFYGGEAVRVQRGYDEVRVQVRYPDDQRKSIADIESIRIKGAGGREIPFPELAEYKVRQGHASIRREERLRRVQINADVDERRTNAEQILEVFEADVLSKLHEKYPHVRYRLGGQHAQMIESLQSLASGFVMALIGIYALLATILRSYSQPMIIMSVIPLGFVGAIVGHYVTGYDLTIMSVFGIVALSGVVVNDSLVLLDQINITVRKGQSVARAVLQAGQLRFRAVVLTTCTTLAGLAPLLLERSTQAQTLIPMAISLTFGLAFATALTLLVVPALYMGWHDLWRLASWLIRGGEFPSVDAVPTLHQKREL